ncbi:RNA polymerase sigma factor [Spirosoma utsteinense]|uniref:RNA polymerase sigma-70 factor (ECF subfamily) n=1 Tax=Spirosoma utsteinense TaxID=2585773 RepID=A0ABR6WBB1_9BACT|nr:sigma-70 family RNA polymerase sigma factor [Spirosoma utsteinense]MBC3786431.1 RNA polymerase sigma-70 factor (ECF subfamily) [Spirosoma utsteinense]MBC3793859.1 RNA polymerase sigma-70 factor (ECF subfamily) [Spirosoma utsteinense]
MFLKRFRRPKLTTDLEYVAVYRATGDLAVLGELYERHMELVYAVCYNYLRDEEEAKDAVMHLFEQLVTDLRRHDVQQFQPWLHSVARNYCLMQLRKRQAHPVAVLITPNADEGSSDEWLTLTNEDLDQPDLEENLTHMETCLQTLPPEQRTCLTLFYLEQKSYTDVAHETGYDLKQVKSYLQNGRRNLKLCMSKQP